jgi:hypothetical protein
MKKRDVILVYFITMFFSIFSITETKIIYIFEKSLGFRRKTDIFSENKISVALPGVAFASFSLKTSSSIISEAKFRLFEVFKSLKIAKLLDIEYILF